MEMNTVADLIKDLKKEHGVTVRKFMCNKIVLNYLALAVNFPGLCVDFFMRCKKDGL